MRLSGKTSSTSMSLLVLLLTLLRPAGGGVNTDDLSPRERNKLIIQQAWDRVINQGDLEAAGELCAGAYV